jgi:hypothetical protein
MAIPWEEFTLRNQFLLFLKKVLCEFPVTTDPKGEKFFQT